MVALIYYKLFARALLEVSLVGINLFIYLYLTHNC